MKFREHRSPWKIALTSFAAFTKRAREMREDQIILANLCGRGDKDIFTVATTPGVEI